VSKTYKPCEVTLEFGDGEYLFKLTLKTIAELQEKCGAGLGTIYKRVLFGDYYAADLVEVVRLGLVGGGQTGPVARKIIERYCDEWPLEEWHKHASAILRVCVHGYDDKEDAQKKSEQETTTMTDGSISPPPTEPDSTRESTANGSGK